MPQLVAVYTNARTMHRMVMVAFSGFSTAISQCQLFICKYECHCETLVACFVFYVATHTHTHTHTHSTYTANCHLQLFLFPFAGHKSRESTLSSTSPECHTPFHWSPALPGSNIICNLMPCAHTGCCCCSCSCSRRLARKFASKYATQMWPGPLKLQTHTNTNTHTHIFPYMYVCAYNCSCIWHDALL